VAIKELERVEIDTIRGLPVRGPTWREVLVPTATLTLLVLAWEAAVGVFRISPIILPPPSAALLFIGKNLGLLLAHTWATTYEILLGFLLAIVVGVVLSVVMIHSRVMSEALYPLLVLSQVLPKVAVAPLLLLWLGYGMLPKVVIAFTIAFFPIVINGVSGLTNVDPEMLDLLRVLKASRWQVLVKIRIKNALPYFFDSLKIAITLAVIGAIVAEFLGGDTGLGYLIIVSNSTISTTMMFAALIVLSVLGMLLFALIMVVERVAIPWYFTR
jgi:NitT/TauT family transport system permease protein